MTIDLPIDGPNGSRVRVTLQTNLAAHSMLSDRPNAMAQLQETIKNAVATVLASPTEMPDDPA